MRERIIEMQRAFAGLDKKSKENKNVKRAILSLQQTRYALETLWVRTSSQ